MVESDEIRLGAQGKWDELSAQLAAAIELDPTDHGGWWRAAAVSLYGEDAQAFRRSCDELVARFAETSDPLIAKRVAESCLLSPAAAGQLNLARRLAERQLGRIAEAHQSLRAARDVMEQQTPAAESGSWGDAWFHWLRFHILRREAEALIDHKVAKPQRATL